jgi:hypothetical protein
MLAHGSEGSGQQHVARQVIDAHDGLPVCPYVRMSVCCHRVHVAAHSTSCAPACHTKPTLTGGAVSSASGCGGGCFTAVGAPVGSAIPMTFLLGCGTLEARLASTPCRPAGRLPAPAAAAPQAVSAGRWMRAKQGCNGSLLPPGKSQAVCMHTCLPGSTPQGVSQVLKAGELHSSRCAHVTQA